MDSESEKEEVVRRYLILYPYFNPKNNINPNININPNLNLNPNLNPNLYTNINLNVGRGYPWLTASQI
jgi:hypothetical protein